MTKAEKKETKRLRKLERQKKREKKRKLKEMQEGTTDDATPDAKKRKLFPSALPKKEKHLESTEIDEDLKTLPSAENTATHTPGKKTGVVAKCMQVHMIHIHVVVVLTNSRDHKQGNMKVCYVQQIY